jgi:hypothetical protein
MTQVHGQQKQKHKAKKRGNWNDRNACHANNSGKKKNKRK